MENDTKILDSWSMPDDLANQVNKALIRKSITPEQELQDALDEMARDIALIEPDPQDWGWWVMYFIEKLEEDSYSRSLVEILLATHDHKLNPFLAIFKV